MNEAAKKINESRDPVTAAIVYDYMQALDAAKKRWEDLARTGEVIPPELSAIATAGQPVDAVTVVPSNLIDEISGNVVAVRYSLLDGRDIDPADWVLETIEEATEPTVTITVTESAIVHKPTGV